MHNSAALSARRGGSSASAEARIARLMDCDLGRHAHGANRVTEFSAEIDVGGG